MKVSSARRILLDLKLPIDVVIYLENKLKAGITELLNIAVNGLKQFNKYEYSFINTDTMVLSDEGDIREHEIERLRRKLAESTLEHGDDLSVLRERMGVV